MSTSSRDTTSEAAEVQRDIWRRMTGEQRSALAAELSENVRVIAAEGVRQRHPDYDDEQVRLAVIRLQLGDAIFKEVFPDCGVIP